MDSDKKENFELGYLVSMKNSDGEMFQDLIYQSNLIEGISDFWMENSKEGVEVKWPPTLIDHTKAMELIIKDYPLDMIHEEIKVIHKTLMHQLMQNSGEYRKGGHSFLSSDGKFIVGNPLPKYIPHLMYEWIKKTSKKELALDAILDLHYEFETIHPFPDGNGRTGRLLLNWMTLKNLKKYVVIEKQHANRYYKNIQEYRKEFMTQHPQVRFTTYRMLPREIKERLNKEKERHDAFMADMLGYNPKALPK